MTTLYLDTFSGISGDMFLGLLFDLGLDLQQFKNELGKLPLSGYHLHISREKRHGIEGCRCRVQCDETHHHRSWNDIDAMLAGSALNPKVKQRARNFFGRLGRAEARVHGIPIDEVHFHEVGAVDAIVDLIGAAIGLDLLALDRVICAPLPLSRGMGECAHGKLPLPAPATLMILQGKPVCDSGCPQELVTPTGATIAAEVAEFGSLPAGELTRCGYGVGGWQLEDRPNLLRGILFEDESRLQSEGWIQVLETNIDDGSPEHLGHLLDRLIAAGALDAGYLPLQMKKNRPGHLLTVICRPATAKKLTRIILRESSSIGVRSSRWERSCLNRSSATVHLEPGSARVKLIYDGDHFLRLTPEYDDCLVLARVSGLPLQEIYRQVESAAYQQLDLYYCKKDPHD